MFYQIMKLLSILVGKVYFRLTSDGREHIPKTGAVLLVANHCSFIDPPLIGCQVPRAVHYMTKEQLLRIPVLSWMLRHLNTIPIRREGIDRKALERAVEVLKRGQMLLIFPEGTRSQDGKIQSPRRGAGMIVAACENVAIVPVYIHGSFEAMPRVARFPRPHKVNVSFGEPFQIHHGSDATSQKEHYQQISVLMMDKIRALQERVSAGSSAH
jgi:1-acyl-sn-glycerol-3-phosphate acyltransferase